MTMPAFSLIDHITWLKNRQAPLCAEALAQLMILVTTRFTTFIPRFVGLTTQNSLDYWFSANDISDDSDFLDAGVKIIIPHNLLNTIQFDYLLLNLLLNAQQITLLLNTVEMTTEFSGFLGQLSGINPTNNQDPIYRSVIESGLMLCPKFLRDAEIFLVTP